MSVGFEGGDHSPWTPDEVDSLKYDWPFYRSGGMNAEGLKTKYKGRTISAISKKYWKVYGRLGKVEKKKETEFVVSGGGLFGEEEIC